MMRFMLGLLVLVAGAQAQTAYFSPRGGCTTALVRTLDAAKIQILANVYTFTSRPIADALVRAKARGLDVRVIVDADEARAKYSQARYLTAHGVRVYLDARHAISHNKVGIIDRVWVATGSFNWSKAAEDRNAENLLLLPLPALVEAYAKDWSRHFEHTTLLR